MKSLDISAFLYQSATTIILKQPETYTYVPGYYFYLFYT